MALPVITGVYRVALQWHDSTNNINAVNVIHFHTDTAGDQSANLNAALIANFTAAMWTPVVSSAWIANYSILALDGSSASRYFTNAGTAGFKGSDTGQPAPQVAVIVKFATGLRGRDKRGRIYLPLTGENSMAAGQVTSTLANGLTTAWNAFNTAMASATPTGFDFCVASYKHAAHQSIIACSGETYTATQRRRQPGRPVHRH